MMISNSFGNSVDCQDIIEALHAKRVVEKKHEKEEEDSENREGKFELSFT